MAKVKSMTKLEMLNFAAECAEKFRAIRRAVWVGPTVSVRESTDVERAMDALLEVALDQPLPVYSDNDEDRRLAMNEWMFDVSKLAEELDRQIKLSQAGTPVIRRP